MSQQDRKILRLARQVQMLSVDVALTWFPKNDEITCQLKKIHYWANALVFA